MGIDRSTRRDTLHVSSDVSQIVLHPSNNDIFVRTGQQAIADCHLGISLDVWLDELRSMLGHVVEWIRARPARVVRAYCGAHGARTVLFLVPQTSQFDFDLADELAMLNIDLVQRFNVGMVEIHQIPEDEQDRFVSPETAQLIYGADPVAHSAVDA